ncbi:protein NO VEIN domain-containing protein [Actinoplanes palleronii]|uniref:Protein NO VEIN C-terminal domain-containing protein n=1 Tax=Actinoplanes palleronii TaxID=113570 RepID=A0ABQ4BEP2_9ACTN|nr:DUF3883 domain-containing protein [Actinoplanes palleronii]GIE69158.1 hypothetical protein Apa02nite_052660 [Actinoplanes palleronii]
MSTLPEPLLRAAVRWLDRLPLSSVARCRALFTNHREFSDLTPTQYEAAYMWLRDTGLLNDLHSALPSEQRVFAATISHANTSWLKDAVDLVRSPDEMPDDAIRAAEALGLAPATAFAYVVTAWGKVDTAERVRVGAVGEAALVDLLRACLDADVDHVAAIADGYGYDVAVGAAGFVLHIEVKSTTRRGRLKIFLSRNEYETMRRDPAWQLVAVRLNTDDGIAAVATVDRHWLASAVPTDRSVFGRWESCRIDVPSSALTPGIPSLQPVLGLHVPPLLTGDADWPGPAS